MVAGKLLSLKPSFGVQILGVAQLQFGIAIVTSLIAVSGIGRAAEDPPGRAAVAAWVKAIPDLESETTRRGFEFDLAVSLRSDGPRIRYYAGCGGDFAEVLAFNTRGMPVVHCGHGLRVLRVSPQGGWEHWPDNAIRVAMPGKSGDVISGSNAEIRLGCGSMLRKMLEDNPRPEQVGWNRRLHALDVAGRPEAARAVANPPEWECVTGCPLSEIRLTSKGLVAIIWNVQFDENKQFRLAADDEQVFADGDRPPPQQSAERAIAKFDGKGLLNAENAVAAGESGKLFRSVWPIPTDPQRKKDFGWAIESAEELQHAEVRRPRDLSRIRDLINRLDQLPHWMKIGMSGICMGQDADAPVYLSPNYCRSRAGTRLQRILTPMAVWQLMGSMARLAHDTEVDEDLRMAALQSMSDLGVPPDTDFLTPVGELAESEPSRPVRLMARAVHATHRIAVDAELDDLLAAANDHKLPWIVQRTGIEIACLCDEFSVVNNSQRARLIAWFASDAESREKRRLATYLCVCDEGLGWLKAQRSNGPLAKSDEIRTAIAERDAVLKWVERHNPPPTPFPGSKRAAE